jgi:hypothetical protein
MISRRQLLAGTFGLAASGLLLPERKFWQLDQTMIPATEPWMISTTNRFTVESIERYVDSPFTKWHFYHRGVDFERPWDEWSAWHDDGGGFTMKVDGTIPETVLREELLYHMRRIEWQQKTIGTAGPISPSLEQAVEEGYAQSIALGTGMPEVTNEKPEWPEWWA